MTQSNIGVLALALPLLLAQMMEAAPVAQNLVQLRNMNAAKVASTVVISLLLGTVALMLLCDSITRVSRSAPRPVIITSDASTRDQHAEGMTTRDQHAERMPT